VRRTSNLVGPIFMFDAFPDIGSSFRLVLEPVLASFKSGNIASTWAAGIVLSGLLLIVAFVGRVLVRIVQTRKATRLVLSSEGHAGFLREFDSISEALGKLGPIGRAWQSFKPTLVFSARHGEQRSEVRLLLPHISTAQASASIGGSLRRSRNHAQIHGPSPSCPGGPRSNNSRFARSNSKKITVYSSPYARRKWDYGNPANMGVSVHAQRSNSSNIS
jgi:hypothetical protein